MPFEGKFYSLFKEASSGMVKANVGSWKTSIKDMYNPSFTVFGKVSCNKILQGLGESILSTTSSRV